MKKRVTGLGGIFFKAKDPKALSDWYDKHLNVSPLPDSPWGEDDDAPLFEWRDKDDPSQKRYTVFGVFPDDTDYFEPGNGAFMFNFLVDDLDTVLADLEKEGIKKIGKIHDLPFGRFTRISDPEGNMIELFEPKKDFFNKGKTD